MSNSSDARKRVDSHHVVTDLHAAYVELLSAVCAIDRVRMRHTYEDIANYCEPTLVSNTIRSANSICQYISKLEKHLGR